MIKPLILRIKRFWLQKQAKPGEAIERAFTSVKLAGRLGVLYRADQEYSAALIKKLSIFCEENHLRLIAMGYVDGKELGKDHTPHKNSDYFCNVHLNRLNLPERANFTRFIEEKQDYLLNLYCKPCVPLLGVSSLSEAKFRVGPYLPQYIFCFDLMLHTKTTDVLAFTDEVLLYLKKNGNG
ncbi:MAG: hypothetical protein ACI8ZN_001962 [Bacteroidia bacterium]|jgi:hypothetical protein